MPGGLARMAMALCLTACVAAPTAPLRSSLAAAGPATGETVAWATVAAGGGELHAGRMAARLRALQDSGPWGVPVRIEQGPGARVRFWIANARLFEAGSGQLRVEALGMLADLATAVVTLDATVVHLRVDADRATGDMEPDALAARRARALESVLAANGLPENRRRALPWRDGAGPGRTRIDLLAVERGQEALAWKTPTD